jgi:hypothetical protein
MQKMYLSAEDVSEVLNVSIGYAYKVICTMNDDLKKGGYMIIAGKAPQLLD